MSRQPVARNRRLGQILPVALLLAAPAQLRGHELATADEPPTYRITPAAAEISGPKLRLSVRDDPTGQFTACRFILRVDDRPYVPETLGVNGLHFVSIHPGRKEIQKVTYARGTGPVEVPLPAGAGKVEIRVVKGYEYLPQTATVARNVGGASPGAEAEIRLRRWVDLAREGWLPTEEHLHYDRLDAARDPDFLTMLAADDLVQAHFLVARGGGMPGVWARQFAFGVEGQAGDGARLLRPGEEFRDPEQGHINLLGIGRVIEPISIGGLGKPAVPYNYPPFHDVFVQSRASGGIGGVAHGATLAKHTTSVADAVLGVMDFFEIANTHLYEPALWYRLLNCGYVLPPMAGTDLPNFPYRESWQPFLGEVRTYVRVGAARDFETWKQAVRRGEVFITGGPILRLSINGVGPGGTLRLPAGGDEVRVEAELASPAGLESFEIVQQGQPLALPIAKTTEGPVQRWRIRSRLTIHSSCWLAARGTGPFKQELAAGTKNRYQQHAPAHTAAIRIEVGAKPIRSAADAQWLTQHLVDHQTHYQAHGVYEQPEHRQHVFRLFQDALDALAKH